MERTESPSPQMLIQAYHRQLERERNFPDSRVLVLPPRGEIKDFRIRVTPLRLSPSAPYQDAQRAEPSFEIRTPHLESYVQSLNGTDEGKKRLDTVREQLFSSHHPHSTYR